jgi:hypothetical protein
MVAKQKHSPEPWKFDDGDPAAQHGSIVDATDDYVCSFGAYGKIVGYTKTEREANGERIAASVNACVGMSDPVAEVSALRRRDANDTALIAEVTRLREFISKAAETIELAVADLSDEDVYLEIAKTLRKGASS